MSTDPREPGPLAVGMQVRAIDSEPVFASDPSSGDLGEVVEASSTSYLVRWKSGAETWMQRANLEPLGPGASPLTDAALPAPVAATMRGGRYLIRYAALIVFVLLLARSWLSSLSDTAAHPSARSVAAMALVLVVLVVGVVFGVRQTNENRAARAERQLAFARARAETQAAHEQDAPGGTRAP
jgi:hypothetical protein